MCIILLAENKQLTKGILEKAESANPHGAGIAWINDNTKTKNVKWIKGINLDTKGILKLIKIRKIKTPYIVHFRIASVGSTSDKLCHPFDLNALLTENKQSGKSEAGVLFHNGTMTDFKTHYDLVFEAGKLNDTKGIFNNIELELSDSRVMSYIANKNRLGLGYLEKILGQKIAVLTKEGIKTYGSGWATVEDFKTSNDHSMRYNSCEYNFYGNENYENFGYNSCYPKVEIKQLQEKKIKKKFDTKQIISQTEKRIKELENKLKSKIGKKELKKINKALKKSKKRLNKELKREIKKYKSELVEIEKQDKLNALNKQNKITSYNGHGNFCNCLKCYKSRDLNIDQNRQRMENKVRINQSTKIIALDKLTEKIKSDKSLITQRFEKKEIDYFNDLLDSEYILEQIDYLGILTDQETELIYNYLKILTYQDYDNIYANCLDKEFLKIELLELAKISDFSNDWKKELMQNGVKKW